MAEISFAVLNDVIDYIINSRHPILLRGRHGVGKSEFVAQLADRLCMSLIMRRCSQMTEGDLLGMPWAEGSVTKYRPPEWYQQACDEAVVLFLDEIDRASLEVRQGVFELTDSRQIAGNKLHPDTIVIAAINGGSAEGSTYSVNDLDPAEQNRYTIFDLVPTVDDWLTWAKGAGKIPEVVTDFIAFRNEHLEHNGKIQPGKIYPSRRSWKRFSDCIVQGKLLDGAMAGDDGATDKMLNLSYAYLGTEAGIAFTEWVREARKKVVTVQEILNGKGLDKVKKCSTTEHNALIDKFSEAEFNALWNEKRTDAELDNLVKYLFILPGELAVKLWNVLNKTSDEIGIKNVAALYKRPVNLDGHKQVGSYMLVLFGGLVSKKKEDDADKK